MNLGPVQSPVAAQQGGGTQQQVEALQRQVEALQQQIQVLTQQLQAGGGPRGARGGPGGGPGGPQAGGRGGPGAIPSGLPVIRGGGWDQSEAFLRVSARYSYYGPTLRVGDIGFRVAREPIAR